MERLVLTDEQWGRIEHLLPGRFESVGTTAKDNRLFVEAVLWVARTSSPWRDLPGEFGNWNSNFVRFNRWSKAGVWQWVFETLAQDPDFEYAFLDSTVVRAHQHAAGAKGGRIQRRLAAAGAASPQKSMPW